MKQYQKSYQNEHIEEMIADTLDFIQEKTKDDWNGITSNELWVRLNRNLKGKKWICSKLTYLNVINRMIKDGLLVVNKKKRWQRKRLLKLDKVYVDFFKDLHKIEKWHKEALKNFENVCKKYKNNKKRLAHESMVWFNFVVSKFGWEFLIRRMEVNTKTKRKAYEKLFIDYSNVLLFFIKDFLKICRKYGINKGIKELKMRS